MKSILNTITSLPNLLKRKWKIITVILIIGALFIAWQVNKKNATNNDLTFEPVEKKDITKTLDVSGVVDAKERARLRFLAGGKLVYLGAQEGEWVKKWQTIASIDKAALQKQLDQDLNNYMKERWDFEDTMDEYEYDIESKPVRKAIDQEQWDLENKVLSVEIRDIAIRESSLYAPFGGVLVKSPATVTGIQILSSDYFEIVNPKTLVFKAEIDESDIGLLSLNQQTTIELDAYDNETLDTYLNYISYSSYAGTSGTVFLIEFPIFSENIDKYRIGMNGDAQIILDTRENVLVVPFEATISRDGKYYVQIKTDEGTTEKEIKIGLETDDFVEVTEGLSEGEMILIPE
jgi:RND family efflux transporter MFP subunit